MLTPILIKDLLNKAVRRAGIEKEVHIAQILEAADRAIAKLLPQGHAADAKALALREGVLTVTCRHSSATQIVYKGSSTILDAVKRLSPKVDIQRICTRIELTTTRPSGVIE